MTTISIPATLVAGNYDRDVEQAVRSLKYQKDPEKRAYEDALKIYKEKREQSLNEMIGVLGRRSAGEDISSPWNGHAENGLKAVAELKGGILLVFKGHRAGEDFAMDKTGLKEFVERETTFFETLKSKQVFPLARKRILEIKEQTSTSTKSLDERWKSIERDDAAIDAILEQCKSDLRKGLEETAKSLHTAAKEFGSKIPEVGDLISALAKLSDPLIKGRAVMAEEEKVWRTFVAEREVATKIHEQINFSWVEESIKLARSAAESTSEWSGREDYPTFQAKALKVLEEHAAAAKENYEKFMNENKGRFIQSVDSKWLEILTDPNIVDGYRVLFDKEGKSLIELIDKHETTINNLKDSKWTDALNKLKGAREMIIKWHEGYQNHVKAGQDLKR